MAQSGHAIRNSKVRFRGQSRHRSDMPFCLLIIQSRHFQLRLVGPVFWPRLRLIALNRCVSLSRASIFSSSRVILDLGSSVPRNFSSACQPRVLSCQPLQNLTLPKLHTNYSVRTPLADRSSKFCPEAVKIIELSPATRRRPQKTAYDAVRAYRSFHEAQKS
jgi:hypothetical protein